MPTVPGCEDELTRRTWLSQRWPPYNKHDPAYENGPWLVSMGSEENPGESRDGHRSDRVASIREW